MVHEKREKKATIPSITDLILFALEKTVEGVELFVGSAHDLRKDIYRIYGDYPRPITQAYLARAIKRLRQRHLVETDQRKTGELIVRLTQMGKEFLALRYVDENVPWDGRWRIVIFDIPESKKEVRNIFRRKLKFLGFEQWQKSVWAVKRPIVNQMRYLVKKLGIDDWVLVIESDNVGLDSY